DRVQSIWHSYGCSPCPRLGLLLSVNSSFTGLRQGEQPIGTLHLGKHLAIHITGKQSGWFVTQLDIHNLISKPCTLKLSLINLIGNAMFRLAIYRNDVHCGQIMYRNIAKQTPSDRA
ncbi:hypothetical protein, partial [Desulfovibrio porci]|uniref:hypothetical protein n=1 Tax=Desulfovibrio porci TaxID=2605782 RepID=UPI001E336EF7